MVIFGLRWLDDWVCELHHRVWLLWSNLGSWSGVLELACFVVVYLGVFSGLRCHRRHERGGHCDPCELLR